MRYSISAAANPKLARQKDKWSKLASSEELNKSLVNLLRKIENKEIQIDDVSFSQLIPDKAKRDKVLSNLFKKKSESLQRRQE